jgi:hypothetical protein
MTVAAATMANSTNPFGDYNPNMYIPEEQYAARYAPASNPLSDLYDNTNDILFKQFLASGGYNLAKSGSSALAGSQTLSNLGLNPFAHLSTKMGALLSHPLTQRIGGAFDRANAYTALPFMLIENARATHDINANRMDYLQYELDQNPNLSLGEFMQMNRRNPFEEQYHQALRGY